MRLRLIHCKSECCCSPPCPWYYLHIVLLDIIYIIITLSVKPLSQICQQLDHSHISNGYLDVQSGSDRITLTSPTATWMYRAAVTGSLSYLQLLPGCTERQWQDHSHISNHYLDVQSGSDRITLISPTATWMYRAAATMDIRCWASD